MASEKPTWTPTIFRNPWNLPFAKTAGQLKQKLKPLDHSTATSPSGSQGGWLAKHHLFPRCNGWCLLGTSKWPGLSEQNSEILFFLCSTKLPLHSEWTRTCRLSDIRTANTTCYTGFSVRLYLQLMSRIINPWPVLCQWWISASQSPPGAPELPFSPQRSCPPVQGPIRSSGPRETADEPGSFVCVLSTGTKHHLNISSKIGPVGNHDVKWLQRWSNITVTCHWLNFLQGFRMINDD